MGARVEMDRIKLPRINFQKDLKVIADRIVIPDLQAGIHMNRDVNGKAFPKNERSTIKAKGHNRVLIGKERKLIKSFKSRNAGKYKVIVYIDQDREDVGRYLQIEGIRSKSGKKIYEFFGVRKDAELKAIAYMQRVVREAVDNAR